MSGPALAEAALLAEIGSPKATIRSLGVLYGFCIGLIDCEDKIAWRRINDVLRTLRGGDMRFVDQVKRAGWSFHEAMLRQVDAASIFAGGAQ